MLRRARLQRRARERLRTIRAARDEAEPAAATLYGASEDDGTALSVWCGDWDLATCLPRECARKGLPYPEMAYQWVDVRKAFSLFKHLSLIHI